jgi:hypothetical protein
MPMKKLFDYKINFIKRNPMLSVGISFFKGVVITLLLLLPYLSFSQVSNWRSNPPTPQRSTPSVQTSAPQRNDVSNWRNQPQREYNRYQTNRRGSNIIVRDPFFNDWGWGWNRWNMWGAPGFGWNYYSPSFYMNDWGYRQPARIYVYGDGKQDTIRGKKPIINFGIQKSTNKQIGGFITIGSKVYFIGEFNTTYERDRSTFFEYGNITQVDFPLIDDYIRLQTYYAGIGKRFKRTGVHFMVGGVSERVRWRGKDDIGEITFPKYTDRFMSVKVGALHDFKNLTLKVDYDPIIKNTTFGVGLNF